MVRSYLIIAIGDDQQRIDSIDAATKKLQQVERGFVRPVNIFDDRNYRPASAF